MYIPVVHIDQAMEMFILLRIISYFSAGLMSVFQLFDDLAPLLLKCSERNKEQTRMFVFIYFYHKINYTFYHDFEVLGRNTIHNQSVYIDSLYMCVYYVQ